MLRLEALLQQSALSQPKPNMGLGSRVLGFTALGFHASLCSMLLGGGGWKLPFQPKTLNPKSELLKNFGAGRRSRTSGLDLGVGGRRKDNTTYTGHRACKSSTRTLNPQPFGQGLPGARPSAELVQS